MAHLSETVTQEEILRALVERHGGAIYRVAVAIVRDHNLAEDVVQETFLRAWRSLSTYRREAPLRHWLLRIAHNTAVSTLRTIREEPRDPSTLPAGPRDPGAESVVQTRMAIARALDALDPLSRTIVVLREVEDLSYEEIGGVLDLPLPTVKTRLFRARRTLQKMEAER